MKILITGGAGFIGSHLVEHYQYKAEVVVLDNFRTGHRKNLNGLKCEIVEGSILDRTLLDQIMPGVDYVFHLAAQSYPATSFTAPLDTLDTNIQGTARLLEGLRAHTDLNPVVHVCASSEVFGRVSADKLPINEECGFHPASPYAISKVGTDLIGRYYAEAFNMTVMTTRMFTHTGPRRGDVFAESTFAKQIAMIEGGLLPPVLKTGNLQSMRTWADVRDAVRAYYMLVTVNPTPAAYYNIGGNFSCTIEDMLKHLLSLSTVKNIKVELDPARVRPIDADLQVPDTRKFQAHTGWKPEISFEKTMGDLLEYWRKRVAAGETFPAR